MELGATELYFALAAAERPLPSALKHTDPLDYLNAAAHWAHAYITGPNDAADTLNLFDVSGLAHFELFRAITADHPGKLEVTQSDLLSDLRKQLESTISQGNSDPFGFGFSWDTFDTTTHGTGLSVVGDGQVFPHCMRQNSSSRSVQCLSQRNPQWPPRRGARHRLRSVTPQPTH